MSAAAHGGEALEAALAFSPDGDRGLARASAEARHFAARHLRPAALALDARASADPAHIDHALLQAGARAGLLTASLPRPWGGRGLGIAAMSVVMEELCAADAGMANVFGAHALGMLPVLLANDPALAERLLVPVSVAARRGAPRLCAFAITEPGGGSDVEEAEGLARGDVQSHAVRVSGGYRLHGRKVFISNGNLADDVVVFVALDRRDPRASWTAFVVRRGSPGFAVGRLEHKLGQRACPAAELIFDDVFVPSDLRVGPEGGGAELSRRVLAISRGPVGAIGVGLARDAFTLALAEVRAQRARRQPGADAAWLDDALARMVVQIRAARAAYLEAGRHADQVLLPSPAVQAVALRLARLAPGAAVMARVSARRDRDPAHLAAWAHQGVLSATAKISGSDAAMAATTVALDIITPGSGDRRSLAEKAFRDAKLTQIYEGTNQINLRSIASEAWVVGRG